MVMADDGMENQSQLHRIEETVIQILQGSDLETATEFSVRAAAAERLGFDLSALTHRRLVHKLIDSFLLSNAASILGTTSSSRRNTDVNNENETTEESCGDLPLQFGSIGDGSQRIYNGKVICKLSDKRGVIIHDFKGRTMVTVRDFLTKDGSIPLRNGSNSGITLTATEWSFFKNSFSSVEEAIVTLESRLRSEVSKKQSEEDMEYAIADSAAGDIQSKSSVSNLTSTVRPSSKRRRIDPPESVNASYNKKEHIPTERKQIVADKVNVRRSELSIPSERKQNEADTSIPVSEFPSEGQLHDIVNAPHLEQLVPSESRRLNAVHPEHVIPTEITQTEYGMSAAPPTFPDNEQLLHRGVIPIQPVRLNERNYYSWRLQMKFFLEQLRIAYVLTEPCPSIVMNMEASFDEKVKRETAIQKWINDDCMCRRNILNCLCDNLFQFYSQKAHSAKELWEELHSMFNNDFGTKMSQINQYVHFQMVDGISILEQVQELNNIADSIKAFGIWMDKNFHVSVVVSKLPPSWNEFRVRLMHKEFITLNALMNHLQVEEESRFLFRMGTNHNNGQVFEQFDCRSGMLKRANKGVYCRIGKEGYAINNYAGRPYVAHERSNVKGHGASYSGAKDDKYISSNRPDRRMYEAREKSKERLINNNHPARKYEALDRTKEKGHGVCYSCGKEGHISSNCPIRTCEPLAKDKGNGACYNCGKEGHMSYNCLYKPLEMSKEKGHGVCYSCGEVGHVSSNCPIRYEAREESKEKGHGVSYSCGKEGHISSNCSDRTYETRGKSSEKGHEVCYSYGKDEPINSNCLNRMDEADEKRHRVCHSGKEGHISSNCPDRTYEAHEKSNKKGHRVCHNCGKEGHRNKDCPDGVCYCCGKKGHINKNCPDGVCYICNKEGHLSKNCPNSYEAGEKRNEKGHEISYHCGKEGHRSMTCPDRTHESHEKSNEEGHEDPCARMTN